MTILNWFINFGITHNYLVYGVILLISAFEGPILALVCGLLLRFGSLSFLPAYISLMLGDLLGDTIWYWIGRRFGQPFIGRYGKYFKITSKDVTMVERIFHKYKDTILIVSKITMGFGFALVTLITAGLVKIPFRRYIILNTAGQVIWTGFLLLIGYFVGNLYVTFNNIFARVSIIAGGVIVLVAVLQYGKFIRARITKQNI